MNKEVECLLEGLSSSLYEYYREAFDDEARERGHEFYAFFLSPRIAKHGAAPAKVKNYVAKMCLWLALEYTVGHYGGRPFDYELIPWKGTELRELYDKWMHRRIHTRKED